MFQIENIGNRNILVKGLGKLFYQDGIPIGILINKFKEDNVEISVLHLADELQKNGWNTKTILSKLKEEFVDSNIEVDYNQIENFLNVDYDKQRKLIFNYLFNSRDEVKKFFKRKLNDKSQYK